MSLVVVYSLLAVASGIATLIAASMSNLWLVALNTFYVGWFAFCATVWACERRADQEAKP